MELKIFRCILNQEKSASITGVSRVKETTWLTRQVFTSIEKLTTYYQKQFDEVVYVETQTQTTRYSRTEGTKVTQYFERLIKVHDSHIRAAFDVVEETLEVIE